MEKEIVAEWNIDIPKNNLELHYDAQATLMKTTAKYKARIKNMYKLTSKLQEI
jgi:hypothetical protein